jgi:hypothetical protein
VAVRGALAALRGVYYIIEEGCPGVRRVAGA